jgi:hypothetical protein
MISRKKFVEICALTINETRKCIKILNQESGYLEYHDEVKYNNYVDDILRSKKNLIFNSIEEYLFVSHKAIKRAGVGHCGELAIYLFVELIKKFKEMSVDLKISLVRSKKMDHNYLHIEILLDNEKIPSTWEVDAWHPRIFDRSEREDGSLKNAKKLIYGETPKIIYTMSTDYIELTNNEIKLTFRLPEPDGHKALSRRSRTPDRDVLKKHDWLFSDYPIKMALEKRDLIMPGEKLAYSQQVSSWQRKRKEKENDKNFHGDDSAEPRKLRKIF